MHNLTKIENPVLPKSSFDAALAQVTGGFTCFYMGGTYFENEKGEKLRKIMPYYECYKKQISG